MTRAARVVCAWVVVAIVAAVTPPAGAGPPFSGRAAVPSLAHLKRYYEIPDFRIGGRYDLDRPESWQRGGEGGVTLESLGAGPLRLGYIAVGTPRRNAAGEITNAIVINSYYSGDSTNMYFFWYEGQPGNGFAGGPLIGPGRLFDTRRYYVILIDALGLWGASKPSDGLGMDFPRYSNFDLVQASYRLLRDHLKVAQVELATGVSMGGSQSYVWGVLHSGFVKAIMPIGGATAGDGDDPVQAWIFQLMTAAIESDPVWRQTGGRYYHLPKEQHPNRGVMFGWSVLAHTGFDFAYRARQPWSEVVKDVFYWDPPGGAGTTLQQRARDFDAVDLWYRNLAGTTYNLNKDLHRITARTLVVHLENDQWLIADKARAAVEAIPGAQLVTFRHDLAHYAVFRALNVVCDDPTADAFLRDIGLIPDPARRFEARNYRVPRVEARVDPARSFWRSAVVYPFPVKYAQGTDGRGVTWEIGYMDEYEGKEKNPPTLVIVHGKGAFGAHYGYVMKYALERGFRVIVPDLPHYGMSGPGNLDRSPARTLDDMREVLYDVVVRRLGVKKAWYLGHSLGGQLVMGYALRYPDAVRGLILEAPSGLEEFPRTIKVGDRELPLFDAAYARDFEKWKEVWGPTGVLDKERGKTAQDVRDFFYFRRRDPKTGQVEPAAAGYFKRDTEYARLHTRQRVAIIGADRREYEQYVVAFVYDIYSIGNELVRGDPHNLYQRLPRLKAPIFLAFGTEEPFIPSTALNGLRDLARDVLAPFVGRMAEAGNRPVLKLYPGVGHFIHTDVPAEFARDVVDFMRTGRVEVVTPAVVEALVHGRPAGVGGGAGAGGRPEGLSK
jgi:homoserine O-acetyltransferase